MAEVGKNIKKIRKEKKLTQEDLAERLHCTRQTISNYETGKSEPNIAVLVDIAETLEVDVSGLIYGPQKKENTKRQKVRAVISLAAAGALQILVSVLMPYAKQYQFRYFETAPFYLLRYVLQPFVFVVFGWGMAEAGKAFAGLRIWEGRPQRMVRIAHILFYVSAVILAVFAVLSLWTAVDLTYLWWQSERMVRLHGAFDSSLVPHLMPGWLQSIFLRITLLYFANSLNGICLFWGAALSFFRIKREESDRGNEIKGQS